MMMTQIRSNRTLRELMTGAGAYCLIWEIVLLIFTQRRLYHSIGLTVGFILCIVLAVSMADSIDVAVDLDEKGAKVYLQKKASLRYLIVCAAIIILAVSDLGNPLTCFAGVMGLKIGAYIQPFVHKLSDRLKGVKTTDG